MMKLTAAIVAVLCLAGCGGSAPAAPSSFTSSATPGSGGTGTGPRVGGTEPVPAPAPIPTPTPAPSPYAPAPVCTSRWPAPLRTGTQTINAVIGPPELNGNDFQAAPAAGPFRDREHGAQRLTVTWDRADAPLTVRVSAQGTGLDGPNGFQPNAVLAIAVQTGPTTAEACWDGHGNERYVAFIQQANRDVTQRVGVTWTYPLP